MTEPDLAVWAMLDGAYNHGDPSYWKYVFCVDCHRRALECFTAPCPGRLERERQRALVPEPTL